MRSASRDVVDRFTGNRGYFHRPDRLRRWKNGAAFLAVGLVLGWVAVEFASPRPAVHSHGELAHPHAAFDSNCEACHKPHSAGELLADPLSLFDTRSRWHDLTCTKCHAGPAHHATARDGGAFHNDCSNCHHDHKGRETTLVRMADRHCTQCHADLPAAHAEGTSTFATTVTGFAKDHPEFRPLAKGQAEAQRRLKFSHALHLTPGLVYDSADKHPWTSEELGKQFGAAAKARYASADGNGAAPIQLTCASCHQLDAGHAKPRDPDRRRFDQLLGAIGGEPRQSLLPPRARARYYLPVNFDMHCKACHPLRTPPGVSGGKVIEPFAVAHRKQLDTLRGDLRGEYAARLAIGKHPAMALPLGPGGRLDPAQTPQVAAFGKEVNRLTDAAVKALMLNLTPHDSAKANGGFACGKCHYAAEAGKAEIARLPDRSVWFEHAKFNHAAHRGVTCAECHPGTSGPVNEREPALIAGIKTCQTCHAPAAGVRHACTDCHRYHNGDRPLQGLGSPRRDPAAPLDINQWLQGKP